VNLTAIDWLLIAIYFVFVLGIGVGPEAPDENQHGLLSGLVGRSGMDLRPGIHFRKPRRPGSDWHGASGAKLRHRHEPLLLDWRDPGDGVS